MADNINYIISFMIFPIEHDLNLKSALSHEFLLSTTSFKIIFIYTSKSNMSNRIM